MNILHKRKLKQQRIHNILGFQYILETKESYFDISCTDQKKCFIINGIYETLKKDLNEPSLEERILTLAECYDIVLVNNSITLIKGQKIKYFDGEKINKISFGDLI